MVDCANSFRPVSLIFEKCSIGTNVTSTYINFPHYLFKPNWLAVGLEISCHG